MSILLHYVLPEISGSLAVRLGKILKLFYISNLIVIFFGTTSVGKSSFAAYLFEALLGSWQNILKNYILHTVLYIYLFVTVVFRNVFKANNSIKKLYSLMEILKGRL